MIAKEIVRLHLKLRKAEYIAECIKNGEIKDTEENKKCFDNITHYKELLQQLEQQSELSTIRQSIQKVMRKSLICYNWEQVHSTYVFLLYNYTMQVIDGMLPLSIDQCSSIDVHNLMSQLYISFPCISYSCFLFDDYFVCFF